MKKTLFFFSHYFFREKARQFVNLTRCCIQGLATFLTFLYHFSLKIAFEKGYLQVSGWSKFENQSLFSKRGGGVIYRDIEIVLRVEHGQPSISHQTDDEE